MVGTLGPLVHQYLTGRVRLGEISVGTAASYRSALDVLALVHGGRAVRNLGDATIDRWLEARVHLKPSTKRTQWSYVSKFVDSLVKRGMVKFNPCHDRQAPKRPRVEPRTISQDDTELLLAALPDARARAIVHLEVGMGARRIEVHRARVEDWMRREKLMLLRGKGGHERIVPVPDEAAGAFEAYLAEWPATSGPFFRSYWGNGKPLSCSTLSHYVSDWLLAAGAKRAGGDGISGHALRRTAASEVLDASGDIRAVQQLLGHLHLSSTAHYLRQVDLPTIRSAMEGRNYTGRKTA